MFEEAKLGGSEPRVLEAARVLEPVAVDPRICVLPPSSIFVIYEEGLIEVVRLVGSIEAPSLGNVRLWLPLAPEHDRRFNRRTA